MRIKNLSELDNFWKIVMLEVNKDTQAFYAEVWKTAFDTLNRNETLGYNVHIFNEPEW